MKLTKKRIKELKRTIKSVITDQINKGEYGTIIGFQDENDETVWEVLVVDTETKYIPGHWGAGIPQMDYEIGVDISLAQFIDEEALRKVRGLYFNQA